ncbi:MAG: chorismate synthase [Clostridia bacterium]|nr:chorismate synthase [Clostridia bacterium]
MSFQYGNNLKIQVFGQSHAEYVGATVEGLPAGFAIDFDALRTFMARRAPGQALTTPRVEKDEPVFVSGVTDGVLNGEKLQVLIYNRNTRSKDYSELRAKPRPGHADYPAHVKYGGGNEISGGGQFSARLTAPLCAVGGIVLQILQQNGIEICAHIESVGGIGDVRFDPVDPQTGLFGQIRGRFPAVIDPAAGEKMKERIEEARASGDSVGGVAECKITGLPVGVGGAGFGGLDGAIASAVFGIPAVKGVEFGAGFASSSLCGSENNDEYYYDENGGVKTYTNNCGGILGGMSDGMPVIFRVSFKPTPSIAREQRTVNLETGQNDILTVQGRHDPCVVLRAVPVVEAAAAIAVYDTMNNT